jgi:hypothetical protein
MEITQAEYQLVGIDTERAQDLRDLLCSAEGGCVACATPLPEDYEAVCSSGRCVVAPAQADACPAPDGIAVDVEVHAGASGNGFDCQSGLLAPTLITNQQELDDFVLQCGQPAIGIDPLVAPAVDFDSRVLFAAIGRETTDFTFEYAVETGDGIHVGATQHAYCGGAAPPDSVLLVEMEATPLVIAQDSCYSGMCTGPLPP